MDLVHSQVPETNTRAATAPETGIEPMESSFRARCSDQQLLLRRFTVESKALRPGIAPDLRASKARAASTHRRECPAGIELACSDWKSNASADRPRTLTFDKLRRMDSNHHSSP